MNSMVVKRVWMWIVAAALACLFVCGYNRFGVWRMESEHAVLVSVMVYYLKVQWLGFVVPVAAICAVWRLQAAKTVDRGHLLPDLLTAFTLSWCFICILMWRLQDARMFPE